MERRRRPSDDLHVDEATCINKGNPGLPQEI
jgi:hypothetical protein